MNECWKDRNSPEFRFATDPSFGGEEYLEAIGAGPTPLEFRGTRLSPLDAVSLHAFAEFLARAGQPPKPIVQEPAS